MKMHKTFRGLASRPLLALFVGLLATASAQAQLAQSPIDIRAENVVVADQLPALHFAYSKHTALTVINTGSFSADKATQVGFEAYYRNNRFMIGSEVVRHHFTSEKSDHHQFSGGDFVLSYFFTKTVRPYKTDASIFGFIPVKKSVFNGGLGEVEGVLHVSTLNLNDGTIQGGKMTRITPMVNWYLSKVIRMEFIYGYGILERFNKTGHVQFFESRIQFTLM